MSYYDKYKENVMKNLSLKYDFQIDNDNSLLKANLTEHELLVLSTLLDRFKQWYENEFEEEYADMFAYDLDQLYYFNEYISIKAEANED